MKENIPKYPRVKNMREDSDLKQKHIAEKLNIARNTLSQYETGTRNIPNEILIKMALLYNTSTDYLLGLTNEKTPYKRK